MDNRWGLFILFKFKNRSAQPKQTCRNSEHGGTSAKETAFLLRQTALPSVPHGNRTTLLRETKSQSTKLKERKSIEMTQLGPQVDK